MSSIETAQRDESTGLSGSRAEFASSLSRRLESVLGALTALEQQPGSTGRRDNFLRRVHALGASAKVLGFAAAAETFTHAEQQIRTSQVDTIADDILTVKKCLADLPSLVLRGAYSLAPQSRPETGAPSAPPLISEPLAVVVWGTSDFVDTVKSLDKSANTLEITRVEDPETLRDTCVALGPDVLLLDANQGSITLLVDELAQAPEVASVAIIVANVPENAAPGLLELGVRVVLPARFTEQQLARAMLQARHVPVERAPTPAPIGEVTLKDLAERLAQEIREGLVDAATPSAHIERIDLGDGTPIRAAIWSALAQIREHVVENSGGRIQFLAGPEGSVPLAPRAAESIRGGGRINVDAVDLSGRRILVVDDDPAVAWFVGGTLRAAGAIVTEAHDGAQALEIAYRLWPELIVSDVMMPGLDGFALCHAVKRDVLMRDVPIILLSWKEDLLFRLRDLGADADGYLRKEANASTIVRRVRELLLSRCALENRLLSDRETRGRLDGTTVRLLLELAAHLERPVRIALRDASALYDIRVRHGSLAAITRSRHDGTVEHGQTVLSALLGITAGRFSVSTDRDACEPMFSGSLQETLGPSVLRARAAQRVLSGLTLGLIDSLTLEQDAFGSDLPLLPMSLRPIADELLRGTAPRQLLASGVASVQLLESLLSDVARRGAVRAIADAQGEDLLEREILSLSSMPSIVPPKPAAAPPPLFTFQLSPTAPEAREARPGETQAPTCPTPTLAPLAASAIEWRGKPSQTDPEKAPSGAWDLPSGTLSGVGRNADPSSTQTRNQTSAAATDSSATAEQSISEKNTSLQSMPVPGQILPASNAPPVDDVDWAMELSWDSTPPPIGQDANGAIELPESRPVTSGGFMRPAIATLQRRSLQDTPDLANAVVRAVSEATPSPADAPTIGAKQPAIDPSFDQSEVMPQAQGALSDAPCATDRQPGDTSSSLEQQQHASRLAFLEKIAPGAAAVTSDRTDVQIDEKTAAVADSTADVQRDATLSPHRIAATARFESTTRAPERPPRELSSAFAGLVPDTAPLASVPAAAPLAATSVQQPLQIQHLASGLGSAVVDRPVFAESPTALPVVHQPPRPKAQPIAVDSREPFLPVDRDSEDPVFPLVSTANLPVDVQPSIEIGTSNSQSAIESLSPSDLKSEKPKPIENRDTLRSPEDPVPEAVISQYESAVAASTRLQRLGDPAAASTTPASDPPSRPASPEQSPSTGRTGSTPNSSNGAPKAQSLRPTSAAPISSAQQPRPVGWIQALGLAALAGIVTFAVTVPVASWIRKRQEPVQTEPPVATNTLSGPAGTAQPETSSDSSLGMTAPSVGSDPTPNSIGAPNASAQLASSAKVEEIPVPADVALSPGQALIEVTTGGGHAIFVDDSFVGRGPVRVITVQPGRHVVRTRLNGVERSDSIDVGVGRSLRLSLEQTWK